MTDQELRELHDKVVLFRKLDRKKNNLAIRKDALYAEECRLAASRAKEYADVEKWKAGSLATLLYGVVGKKEKRLHKEEAEAYEAAVKHDAVKAELRSVEHDLEIIYEAWQKLNGCEWEYKKALEERAAELEASGADRGLFRLQRERAALKEQIREIQEALDSSNKALHKVAIVKEMMSTAYEWDTSNIGALFGNASRREKIDEAQEKIEYMQISLSRFQTELQDVLNTIGIDIELTVFHRVADYIFDCLFADVENMTRLIDAQTKINEVESHIRQAREYLCKKENELMAKDDKLKAEWDSILGKV